MGSTITPLGLAHVVLQQYDSQGQINSDVVKDAPGWLADAVATNYNADTTYTLYFMIFDATSVPSNGAVPKFQAIPVPAGATTTMILREQHRTLQMTTGICWAASTTSASLTLDTSDSMWTTIVFA
jgi:hypothetical protein